MGPAWASCVWAVLTLVGASPAVLEIPFLSYDVSTGPLFIDDGYRYIQQQIFAGGSSLLRIEVLTVRPMYSGSVCC